MSGRLGRRRAVAGSEWAAVAAGLTLLASATPALAHVDQGQAQGLLTGLLHPVSGLDHVLAMVSVGLWGAQLGPPAVWMLPVTFFLVLGALIAADRRLSPSIVTTLAAAVGFLHGWLNGAGLAEGQRDALALVGIAGAVFVLVTIAAAFVVSLQAAWARIAVRVAGSWVAGTGLLMLGWWLRGI